MGAFIWHQWGRLVSMTASVYLIWAAIWGILYRKFFWDFVGGVLEDTPTQKGIIPGKNSAPFLAIIITVPLVQILSIVSGCTNLLVELPGPFVKRTRIHRSWILRIVLLILQSFFGILFYQGTNATAISLIAIFAFMMAWMKGERIERAEENRDGDDTV
ncbi:hypothetical protein FRB95_002227 [Tulasnella sp. JGI-2019a]|nr:hypothetical protein FRB95_002227 [Tulasnella sp. JGI-2019a]